MKKKIDNKINKITAVRTESVVNLKIQANRMKEASEKRFCEGKLGETVKIKMGAHELPPKKKSS